MFTIKELLNGYKKKEFSPVEITKQYVERANKHKDLNAFVTITEDVALEQAKIAEQKWQMNDAGRLEGIPLSYKDNIYTKNVRTTSASKVDENFVPNEHADIIKRLNNDGAVMVGKNNMHEFAFGITSNNPFYGAVKNPWNTELIPGGSSGGSAVSVATYSSVGSIGTDTGGSIRIPAAMCGLVGLKPTQDLLPKKGFTNISWSLDHSGPISRNIDDLSILMNVLTDGNVQLYDNIADDLRGVKIGVPNNFFTEQIEEPLRKSFNETLEQLEKLGAHLIEVEVPNASDAIPLTFTLAISEGGYTHRDRKQTSLDHYGEDVHHVMTSSDGIPALDYIHALQQQIVIGQKVDELFDHIDVLATPTLPALPKPIGQEEVHFGDITEPIFDCMIRYTSFFNLTGHPAISIPT
ncbi:MAG TPA: amidase, partial [Pseudogracilibacillus sp.]|nr:amidase [Pseudogracilibacillus sp.]